MKHLALIAVFAFLGACAGKETKQISAPPIAHKEVIPLVGSFKVNRYTMDNGLKLLVVEDHTSPTFAYQTWFSVGSRNEVKTRTGLAHLFEHLMFKATKNHPEGEFDRLLESAGAEGENAFTSKDYTAYVEEMPKSRLELVAALESDRMVNLVVNDKSFKTEREVVQNERRFRNENSPDGIMYQDLFEKAFNAHPYHWPVIGYSKDLEEMTTADPLAFYRAYYSPNHATIAVVGDVDPDAVAGVVKRYYGGYAGQTAPQHSIPAEPEQESPRRLRVKLNIQVEKLLIGYHVPGILSDDIPALEVLQSILTGGRSSRLYRALVETGIASSVDSYDIEDKDPTLFIFTADMQQKKRATQAETVILKELTRLAREPVPDQELARARNKINFGFYEGLSTDSEKAHFLGHYEAVAGDFQLGLNQQKKIQTVTALDVQSVAKRYFEPRNRTVITGVRK